MNTTDSLTSTPARAAHSLSAAVADGTISAEAAFCGLSGDDLSALAWAHPNAFVVVRFRSDRADGRLLLNVADALELVLSDAVAIDCGGPYTFGVEDVRDVLSVAQ